jgi:light-independent protochlorophyllide reductase subunit B
MAAARIARDEIGFEVVGLGCFNREMARPMRKLAASFGVDALISDDYLEVEKHIQAIAPELILGTQMERHIGKRLGIPCAVISAPVHVQDFPARYSPQMGPEGANVIFDTWVHPLVMGLEEHLLTMFRDDFEFHDQAGPSHHAAHSPSPKSELIPEAVTEGNLDHKIIWLRDAEKELRKIPFFVRGKARKNTEKYAQNNGYSEISIETLYEAKAHYAR